MPETLPDHTTSADVRQALNSVLVDLADHIDPASSDVSKIDALAGLIDAATRYAAHGLNMSRWRAEVSK
ncbi:hypothetical protein [Streptomyces sp. A30]|uniref:hypothetical protein n=1 Tax=Streptomyces sp. A30 TaxID=2789273 RepID=UPI003980079B